MNPIEEDEFSRMIYAETQEPPLAMVSLDDILRDGKRRSRRRRLLHPTLAIMSVAAISVGAFLALQPPNRPPDLRSPAAEATGAGPSSFAPFSLRISAGWVPEGLVAQPPVLASGVQQIAFWDAPTQSEAELGKWVDVTLYASDITPWQLAPAQRGPAPAPTVTSAEPVSGHNAEWFTYPASVGPTAGTNALAWEWAPNSWAVVRANISNATEQQAIERRVAEQVRTAEHIAVFLPFTVTSPPTSLHLSKVELREEAPWYSYSLEFGIDNDPRRIPFPISPMQKPHDTLIVSLSQSGTKSHQKPAPNTTIGGYPGAVDFGSSTYGSVVLYRAGYEINVYVSDEDGLRIISKDRAIAIALSIVPLGSPPERSGWTSSPLK